MIWGLLIASSLLVVVTIYSIYTGVRSLHWPTVKGQVISAEVIHIKKEVFSSGRGFHSYRPMVLYRYSVAGQRFQSRRLGNYVAFGSSKEYANTILRRFSGKEEIMVYHHPVFPRLSAIAPGMKQTKIHTIMLAASIIIVAISGKALFLTQ